MISFLSVIVGNDLTFFIMGGGGGGGQRLWLFISLLINLILVVWVLICFLAVVFIGIIGPLGLSFWIILRDRVSVKSSSAHSIPTGINKFDVFPSVVCIRLNKRAVRNNFFIFILVSLYLKTFILFITGPFVFVYFFSGFL